MNAGRIISLILLISICVVIVVLSQLDSVDVGTAYGAVSQTLNIDLKALKLDTVQISNAGHFVAAFVLCLLGQLSLRRRWLLPVVLVFFLALELGQHFTLDRQPGVMDVVRSWSGCTLGYLTSLPVMKIKRPFNA